MLRPKVSVGHELIQPEDNWQENVKFRAVKDHGGPFYFVDIGSKKEGPYCWEVIRFFSMRAVFSLVRTWS